MRLQEGLSLKKDEKLIDVTDGAIGHLENGRMDNGGSLRLFYDGVFETI